MPEESLHSLNLLYWYAPEDQQWRDEIDLHFRDLKRHCHITKVFDKVLSPSMGEDESFLAQLRNTHLVLILVSTHFKAAQAVPLPEVRKSLEWLRWSGDCLVIALLLEKVDWDGAPFGSRDVLPSDARPLIEWPSRELAFHDSEKSMRGAIENRWLMHGDWLLQETHDNEEALEAYEEALRLNPAFSWAWYCKGGAFAGLKRYEEALKTYDEALLLDPSHTHTWYWKGEALKALGRGREARQAKRKARQLGWPF